eukprot:3940892-Rhodomonas_salina.2
MAPRHVTSRGCHVAQVQPRPGGIGRAARAGARGPRAEGVGAGRRRGPGRAFRRVSSPRHVPCRIAWSCQRWSRPRVG